MRCRAWPLLVTTIFLAGCSDGQDESGGPTTSSTPPSVAGEPSAGDGSDPLEPGGNPFCETSGAFDEGLAQIDPAVGDPARLEEALARANEEVEEATRSAPEEIRPDTVVLADAFQDLISALERVDYEFTQLSLESLASLDSPEVQAAQQRLDTYRIETCNPTG